MADEAHTAHRRKLDWYRRVLPILHTWLVTSASPRFEELHSFREECERDPRYRAALHGLAIGPTSVKKKLWDLVAAKELTELTADRRLDPEHITPSVRGEVMNLAISIMRGRLNSVRDHIDGVVEQFNNHTASKEFANRISISLPLSPENRTIVENIGRKLSLTEAINLRLRKKHKKVFDKLHNLGLDTGVDVEKLSDRVLFAGLWKIAGEYIHPHAMKLRQFNIGDRPILDNEVNLLLQEMQKKMEAVAYYANANYNILKYSEIALKSLAQKFLELSQNLSPNETRLIEELVDRRQLDEEGIREIISRTTVAPERKNELERIALIKYSISQAKKIANQVLRTLREKDETQELEALKTGLKGRSEELGQLAGRLEGFYGHTSPIVRRLKDLGNISKNLENASNCWRQFKGMQTERNQRWREHARALEM